jgi:ferredoxin
MGLALGIGIAFGLVQGMLISYLEIQPFIVTLAGMFFARGLITMISDPRTAAHEAFVALKDFRIVIPGIGYYGKNGVFLTPQGSFFFIGIILIDKEVDQYNQALPDETNFCCQCSLCMDNCPTKAIVKPYVVDARKCLSYQTLSNKNPDYEFIKGHPWIYGCDICQEVCPKNKKSVINELAVSNSSLFLHFQDSDFENMTKEQFDHYFANTSIGSKGYEKLIQFIKNRQQ